LRRYARFSTLQKIITQRRKDEIHKAEWTWRYLPALREILLNSDPGVQVSDTTGADSSNKAEKIIAKKRTQKQATRNGVQIPGYRKKMAAAVERDWCVYREQ
jgi:hypothetical protein